ncbi:MAG TPA: cytochrome c-type biogenesis CcmF C-terminal domain-containing protein [Acidimicrobiales bacterium]|nr:cytochrome c-type biogenesis CcmF C-terminal domain-containing protein [Acidimicrobiales bacterium]
MNAALGRSGVLLALAASVAGVAVIAYGLARKRTDLARTARVYAGLVLAGAVVATVAMQRALITHDFSLAFVAANNSRSTPLLYTITGMWSALAGSILLWGLILAGYIVAMVWRFRRQAADPLVAWATLVTLVVAAFFFGLMAGPADPFATVTGPVPGNGLGPNVLLQDNPLVAFHPPLLYLGFVGFTIPFAFAVASLVTGRIGEGWQVATRRWTLFAWGFLTVGIVLGAWWSYQVLGWGGFWAWDPVENASFLPWLCATAYLHSVMVQERRGLLRVWNLSLVIATFCLTILGTFLTRSGVITSVHAFSDSDIGPLLLGFFGVVLAGGVGLIAWRGDRLRSPGGIDSVVSREGAFLVNNLLFVLFAFVVLLGTVFPLLYEAFRGQQVTVGAPYFNAMTLPIGLALLLLMAIGPALPWRKTTASTLRDRLTVPAWVGALVIVACVAGGVRGLAPLGAFGLGAFAAAANARQLVLSARGARRSGAGAWRGLVGRANGGMVVHLGVVVIAVALAAATSFGHRGEVTLRPGQVAFSDGHRIELVRLAFVRTPARTATEALVMVDGHGPLRPAVSQFGANTEAVGTPAIDSSLEDDVYLTVDALPAAPGGPVTIGVTVQPLVAWLWGGGVLLVLGALLAAVPGRRRRPTDPVSAPVPAGETGDPGGGSGDAGPPRPVVVAPAPGRSPVGTEARGDDEHAPEPVPARSP